MTSSPSSSAPPETGAVRVRYWASARSAAGVESDQLAVEGPVSLADVTQQVLALHRGSRLSDVIAACSVLVDDRPAGTSDPTQVLVAPGSTVEFLPPFAGG
jgi:molybdopterin synthase sulfur carrier subunit